MTTRSSSSFVTRACYGLFWSWNVIFLAFLVLGFAPRLLPEILSAVREGTIPASFLINGVILCLVPVGAVVLGLTLLRGKPARLFALGYAIEGPLMLLLVIRFFIIRQANPGFAALMALTGLGLAGFLWYILDPEMEQRGYWNNAARLAGLSLMMLVSVYASLWILFYTFPALAIFVEWLWNTILHLDDFLIGVWQFFKDLVNAGWLWIPFGLLGIVLALYTATLFVLTPIAVPILAARAYLRSLKVNAHLLRWPVTAAITGLVIVTAVSLFVISNRQPQARAFAMLENRPTTVQQAHWLAARQNSIRQGLLNAYLSPFRYISAAGEVSHISDLYENAFHMLPESARWIVNLYNTVASPLLYQPVHPASIGQVDRGSALTREPDQAAALYEQFFDQTIIEGERSAVVSAARSTWSSSLAEAAWQAVDDREVHLDQQEVRVEEHGEWADVELYEVYHNRTDTRQEVVYFFNLPETAVLTGLWMGSSPNRSQRFAYQLAPRGAAQALYQQEVRVQRDPALLEQIGPRQYRLRVFPVEPDIVYWDAQQSRTVTEKTRPVHLWLTYRTLITGGSWPLPQIAHKINVFWDNTSQRTVNGQPMRGSDSSWLPESIPVNTAAPAAAHRADFPGGLSVIVQPADSAGLPGLPGWLRLAVILDRSRSMASHAQQVKAAIEQLRGSLPGSAVDVYLTSSAYSGEQPSVTTLDLLQPEQTFFFGGQNPSDLLMQFEALQDGREYDAILVLTDASAYSLGKENTDLQIPSAPVWMVHLGNSIPLGYDDGTLQAIQASGGGVASSLEEALKQLAVHLDSSNGRSAELLDGRLWTVLPTREAEAAAPGAQIYNEKDGFTALLARYLVRAEIRAHRGTIDQLDTLDQLHALADQYSIVTPYSSMIVLVNEAQQRRLQSLEEQEDRFKREVEPMALTQPPLAGVPEPEEWLLMGMAALMLAWYAYRRKFVPQRR